MARYSAEDYDPERVQNTLRKAGFKHLRARKYGAAVIVESGPKHDPMKHFRIRRDTVHLWCLDFATHRGDWERTPFRDTMDSLLKMVVEQFPWTIANLLVNPERTSDRED